MKNVLVIWWDESVQFINLSVDEKQLPRLAGMQNQFINSSDTDNDMVDDINAFFYTEEGRLKYPTTQEAQVNVKYDLVIITGCAP